jgi:hypothetical protein
MSGRPSGYRTGISNGRQKPMFDKTKNTGRTDLGTDNNKTKVTYVDLTLNDPSGDSAGQSRPEGDASRDKYRGPQPIIIERILIRCITTTPIIISTLPYYRCEPIGRFPHIGKM